MFLSVRDKHMTFDKYSKKKDVTCARKNVAAHYSIGRLQLLLSRRQL